MRTIAPSLHARGPQGLAPHLLARIFSAAPQVAGIVGLAPLSLCLALCLALLPACYSGKGTIGAVIAQDSDSGRLFLREVPASLAAGQANLKPGDEILLIDGLDVRRMDPQQINEALSGDVDSPVKLTLIRQEQILRVTLRRTEAHRLAKKPGKSSNSAP